VHRTKDGVGLEFELSGPVEEALAAAIAGLAARPRRVLIVDDDALVRQILVDAFEARGFEARTAADGEMGLRAIADELLGLDAVVTDVQMPSLHGEALVSAVSSAGGEGELAIVVFGASIDPELTARFEAAGADRILSKDAGVSSVVDAVEEVLRVRATLRPASANEGDPFLSTAVPAAVAAR
jgi:DNA-binding NarL/FixJ family response regulator